MNLRRVDSIELWFQTGAHVAIEEGDHCTTNIYMHMFVLQKNKATQ